MWISRYLLRDENHHNVIDVNKIGIMASESNIRLLRLSQERPLTPARLGRHSSFSVGSLHAIPISQPKLHKLRSVNSSGHWGILERSFPVAEVTLTLGTLHFPEVLENGELNGGQDNYGKDKCLSFQILMFAERLEEDEENVFFKR
ncbi:hypothetical protein BsWGS_17567 [Bradybaena similaris]